VPVGGADGQVLTKLSATNFDTTWETPVIVRQVLPTNNTSAQMWGLPSTPIISVATGNPGWSYTMVVVHRQITVTNMMSHVTTGPGADQSIRWGIWSHDSSTGKPGTLVTDFGTATVLASTTGQFSVSGTAVLIPGEYWVGMRQSAYFACRTWNIGYLGVNDTSSDRGQAFYGSPGTGAFGNAPTVADFDVPARAFTLVKWSLS
jgi:hypothetical protein